MNALNAILYIPSRILGVVLGAILFPLRAIVLTSLRSVYQLGSKAISWAFAPLDYVLKHYVLKSARSNPLLDFLATIGGAIALAVGLVLLAISIPFILASLAIEVAFSAVFNVFKGIFVGLQGGVPGFWSAFLNFDSPFADPEVLALADVEKYMPIFAKAIGVDIADLDLTNTGALNTDTNVQLTQQIELELPTNAITATTTTNMLDTMPAHTTNNSFFQTAALRNSDFNTLAGNAVDFGDDDDFDAQATTTTTNMLDTMPARLTNNSFFQTAALRNSDLNTLAGHAVDFDDDDFEATTLTTTQW